MKRRLLIISALGMTLVSSVVVSADQLASAERKVIVARHFAGQPIPKWQNGFLLARDFPQPNVYVYNRDGAEVAKATLSFPDSIRTLIADVSISPTGRLAVCGTVDSSAGASAAFIAWLTPAGKIERVVRTSPFAAFKISFSNDENLWALGREHLADYNEKPEHHLLRAFNPNGEIIKSLLPRTSFTAQWPHPASGNSFLVTSVDRIGIYSVPAKEWIEFSLTGVLLGRWKGIEADRIAGIALTDSGAVYVSGFHRQKTKGRTMFYRLDRGTASWTKIDAAVSEEQTSTALYGVDKDHLVMASRLPDFLWVRAQ